MTSSACGKCMLNKGYLNVRISQPTVELSDDKKWFDVDVYDVEGEPFTVQEIGFRGNTVFEDHELARRA